MEHQTSIPIPMHDQTIFDRHHMEGTRSPSPIKEEDYVVPDSHARPEQLPLVDESSGVEDRPLSDDRDYEPSSQPITRGKGRGRPKVYDTEEVRKRGRPTDADTIVDISQMLKLPQKTAAAVLGISESMLCKRFKEFTRRKWPYREMMRLNASITQIKSIMMRDGRTPQLEQDLETAQNALRECMMPVRIRFSGPEQLRLAQSNLGEIPGVEIFQVESADFVPITKVRKTKKKMTAPKSPNLRAPNMMVVTVKTEVDEPEEQHQMEVDDEDAASANLLLSLVG